MAIQDTFADAVRRTQQQTPGPLWEPQPEQPPGPVGAPPGGQLPPMGGGAPTVAIHVNPGPPAGEPSAAPAPGDPMDPATYNDALTSRMNDQEVQRQQFASSLSPEVSQAFAAFMDGIAQQEALKQISAPGAARMFGA